MNPPRPPLRSLLFAPASNPDLLRKMPRCQPDGVVLDLEDAVPAATKPEAREHARVVGPELASAHPEMRVYVRVNAVPSDFVQDDLTALTPTIAGVVVPKLESAQHVTVMTGWLAERGLAHLEIIAGLETVLGVSRADEILAVPGIASCYFGAEDYIADLGGLRTELSLEVHVPRSQVAIAARLAGLPALDQVVTTLTDEALFNADARVGRSLGFRGKLCIHPAQVGWANRAFSPTAEEIDRARRLLAAYDDAVANGSASISFEGQMVDEPLARQARNLLGI